jgi:DNA polymerase III delta prime subunit
MSQAVWAERFQMGLLQVIEDAPGYLKATFQGPQGSGKTRTAVELATKTHEFFRSTKPIAFYDSESGSDYIADLIAERTKQKPLRVKTRAFSDLRDVVAECVNGASDVLVVDSITHVWRELQDGYMRKVNENRRYPKVRMDIQDIMQIKKLWEPWPDEFLNSPIHIIVCGREGSEWGNEENEETGKRDLVQTGKKMKVEAEFGYEASLMVSMKGKQIEAAMVKQRGGGRKERPRQIINVATILKDRFDVMNGQVFDFPTGDTFLPFLERLNPKAHRATDTSVRSQDAMPDMDDNGWTRERRNRAILCEEIQGELLKVYPGQTAKDKACKAALIERGFGTRSWTRVEQADASTLRIGLEEIREVLKDRAKFEESIAEGMQVA